jgi:hypothetical protein
MFTLSRNRKQMIKRQSRESTSKTLQKDMSHFNLPKELEAFTNELETYFEHSDELYS